jgi:oligogalacturonide transporter
MSSREVRLRNMLAYGAGDIYGGGAFIIIGTYF